MTQNGMHPIQFRRLIFEEGFEERDEYETPLKGWRGDVLVELSDGTRYRLSFFDPVRLAQELDAEVESGNPFLAEPGLIVLQRVTRENMERAALELCKRGFFETLRPIETKS